MTAPQRPTSQDAQGITKLAWRIFWRYRGRMLFFATAIAVGVGFLIALGNLLDSINGSIARQARTLMAADISISSGQPLPPKTQTWIKDLEKKGEFHSSKMLIFPSMLAPPKQALLSPSSRPSSVSSQPSASSKPSIASKPSASSRPSTHPSSLAARAKDPKSPSFENFRTPILVNIKAVQPTYPFYGALETTPKAWRKGFFGHHACMLDRSLAEQQGLRVGDTVRLGVLALKITALIEAEPDQLTGGGFGALAPRVMIPFDIARKTGLLGFGSRVSYRTLLKTMDPQRTDLRRIADVKKTLRAQLQIPNIRVTAYTEAQPTIRDILQRVAIFFIFVSLVALLLGAIGMAASVTTFLNEQMETVGILRCMGLGPRDISALYTRLCVGIGILGGLFGLTLGIALSAAGLSLVQNLMNLQLAWSLHWVYILESFGLAILLTWGLNAATVRSLAALSPQEILSGRQSQIPLSRRALFWTGLALFVGFFLYAARAALSLWVGGFFTLTLSGMILLCLLFILLALGACAWIAQRIQSSSPLAFVLRHGLRQLVRQRARSLTYLLALTIGVTLISTLQILQQSFEAEVQITRYNKMPNLFLIDVQREQVEGIKQIIRDFGGTPPTFNPLVRARLTHINGKKIQRKALRGASLEARMRANAIRREYNLTYKRTLNESETVVSGRFWKAGSTKMEISLEQRWAQRLGLAIGDTMRFDIVGQPVEGTITSIRTINWRSFLPNFFVVMTPTALQDAPQQLITSVALHPPSKIATFQRALVRRYPNVSVIDLGRVIDLVRGVLGAFLAAMRVLAWVCLAIGLFILAGTLGMGQRERREKVALMRALGCQYRTLVAIDVVEFVTIGLITSVVVMVVSWGTGAVIAQQMQIAFQITAAQLLQILLTALLLPFGVGMLVNAQTYRAGVQENLRRSE
ncbi:MAG: ABC transporter permease [Myxococcales bacterium]|nr:ABC transporter permease [Myxococcales bacterium]